MFRVLLLVITGLALAACQTTGSTVGSGPIKFSPQMQHYVDQYMNSSDPVAHLAVAVDGKSGIFYFYCPDVGCRDASAIEAIYKCEEYTNGVPCKIYANRKKVLWKFDVSEDSSIQKNKKAKPSELTFFWNGAAKAAYVGKLMSGPNPKSHDHIDFALSEFGSDNGHACEGKIVHPYAKRPTVSLKCKGGIAATAVLQKPVNTSDFQIKGTGISNKGRKFTFYINHDYY